jgi:hypothetical protein
VDDCGENGMNFSANRVEDELTRGPEGNGRVAELIQARPMVSVQVARVVQLPPEDRNCRGRQIMAQWLQSARSR